nr:hypothetical protein [Clostridia bacterium]
MKKVIALFLVVSSIFLMVSCAKIDKDPIALAKKLLDDDYWVEIGVNPNYFEGFEPLDVDTEDISCVILVEHEKKQEVLGVVIYCENNKAAKEALKNSDDFIDDLEDQGVDTDDYISKRSGKAVFIGHEDIFEDMK